nr:putative reverse transcriptase domain, aspartic peptidase domain protein [Tanacetum cinerariifolium]
MQDSVRITHVYRNLPLQFDDKIRAINAFPLDMCEFDIILGMDWLTEHHATIDCRSYQVIFGDIHAPEFVYHGSLPGKPMQIISTLQARTLLYHGCEGFLATIHDMTPEIPSIHDQPIVSEFPDVFPDELPGIPPVREVEFNIELNPGPEPISKAPYRMAPVELKELKDQLQELLERGFIRPSVSPWGAPVLFVKKKDEHHATIDCHSYRVIFGDIHAPEYTYHGSLPGKPMQIISALQARTLLYHGCEGFLATIHDMTSETPTIHDQPIVSEFPDVFPDELPGVPPVREVGVQHRPFPRGRPYLQGSLSQGPGRIKGVERPIPRIIRPRLHTSKCVTMGCTSSLCQEEGW